MTSYPCDGGTVDGVRPRFSLVGTCLNDIDHTVTHDGTTLIQTTYK